MKHYDVFNGDADGIIALLQLRFTTPKKSTLISGVKRNIALLKQVVEMGDADSVTVLDISMKKNKLALEALLKNGVDVFYCDHHQSGDIPAHRNLTAVIDTDAEVCTSLLINRHLDGQYVYWAIAAAFGDNLIATANRLAIQQGLAQEDITFLQTLGTLINYNGYGSSLNDLHIHPVALYQQLLEYKNPFDVRDDKDSPYYVLHSGYASDYHHIKTLKPICENETMRVYELPCEAWARRISGVFSNDIANQKPDKAHAVLILNADGAGYTVSVRAPLNNRIGADEICAQFATGGGRKAAAGINRLPREEKEHFLHTLNQYYS